MAARPTLEQQLRAAELKANRLRKQLSEDRRAADTRRKIVVGGTILAALPDDADLRGKVLGLLRDHVTRPLDREVIADLLGEGSPTPLPDSPRNGNSPPPDYNG